jgi:hypothetical protein
MHEIKTETGPVSVFFLSTVLYDSFGKRTVKQAPPREKERL